jgi:hypothetical protein
MIKKYLLFFVLFIYSTLSQAQVYECQVCDTLILDGSGYPSGLIYQWVCSNGQTSNLRTATIPITGDVTCTLTVQDTATGCVSSKTVHATNCRPCGVATDINISGSTLLVSTTNCQGTPTYRWQKWNGSSWVNLGTSTSQSTSGISGLYKVIVTCGFGCVAEKQITYTAPCTLAVPFFINNGVNTALYWITSGCDGFTKKSTIYKENPTGSGVWDSLGVVIHTTTSAQFSIAITAGTYRLRVECNGCFIYKTYTFDPCVGFSVYIVNSDNGSSPPCIPYGTTFRINPLSPLPVTYAWYRDGVLIATTPTVFVNFTTTDISIISVNVTTALGCSGHSTYNVYPDNCCPADFTLNPIAQNICINQEVTLSTTITGFGSGPYTFVWTSQLGTGPVVSQGAGATKMLTFTTAGTYTIRVVMTDGFGCQYVKAVNLIVGTCANCSCTPTLVLSGCTLFGSFSGGGCIDFAYQLQYSLTGSGWASVASGLATAGFTHIPAANGLYRLVITRANCTGAESTIINVTCFVAPCSSPPQLNLAETGGTICSLLPATICGNTFGGSATSVTITENGFGSITTPTTVTSGPFCFTYTPASGDLGTTVTVTLTTNNPLGFPCIAVTRTVAFNYLAQPAPVITSTGSVCAGQTKVITYSPLGGVLTLISGPAVLSGNTITSTGLGSIVVRYTVNNGPCAGYVNATIPSLSCCADLTMAVTETTPAKITAGALTHLGIPVTNYRIQWKKVSDNSVAFTSGAGTGAGGGAITQPFTDYSVAAGAYYAYILTSDVGDNLDCFSDYCISPIITVDNTENYWFDFEELFGITPVEGGYICAGPTDRVIYATNPVGHIPVGANPPIFNTFTASGGPVTWVYTPLGSAPTGNITISAQSSSAITFRIYYTQATVSQNVCGVGTNNYRYWFKLEAFDSCNRLRFRTFVFGYLVG